MAQDNSQNRMSFYEHLDELRAGLVRSLYVFAAGFGCFYFLSEKIMNWLRAPLFAVMEPEKQKLYFTSLFENFFVHLKIAGVASLFFLSPYYFYEAWKFIAPGLHARERKWIVPFISAAALFFIGGAAFAYYGLFPVGFKYFITYGGEHDVPLLTIDAYYTLVLKLMLLFGLSFELPVFVVLLGFLGMVDAELLKKHRRGAIVGIAVVAALFAPPDALSMIILGLPLYLLYELSILVVQKIGVRRSQELTTPSVNPLHGGSSPE